MEDEVVTKPPATSSLGSHDQIFYGASNAQNQTTHTSLPHAFTKTLQKWEAIIEGVPGVHPWSPCGLCRFCLSPDGAILCDPCPLVLFGGFAFCCDNPYSPWELASRAWSERRTVVSTPARKDIPKATETAMTMYLALLMARDALKTSPAHPR